MNEVKLVEFWVLKSFADWQRGHYKIAILENRFAKKNLKKLLKSSTTGVLPDELIFSSTEILPDELIEEIMLWLPVKNLIRLKCVSKKWHSLINSLVNNPYLFKLHQERSKLKLKNEAEIYTEIGENICILLENRNYASAYKEICRYGRYLKAIPKGFIFDSGSRASIYACLLHRFSQIQW
ncbi:hypothetical protein V8G54_015708 [Vigna mungo]|uniref:F-box domain-containing protein n=1 Tax=Vigna mungo TaxID=3915 RepID=A0AAQ3RZR8_VIGMU